MTSDKRESLVTTYLEIRERAPESSGHRPAVSDQNFEIGDLKKPDWRFNREMYFAVGEKWKWIDKRPWTDEQWQEYANDPMLRTFAAYQSTELAGYYELRRSATRDQQSQVTGQQESAVEIAYFGLLPEFIGRGLGSALLRSAIENAWVWTPTPSRVWVHTCNRDHPNALANYQSRGFRVYKVERKTTRKRTNPVSTSGVS